VAPGPVWTGAENLARAGIRFPDRPARSQALYRLRYPANDQSSVAAKSILSISILLHAELIYDIVLHSLKAGGKSW